ncbi:hypothetical protein RJT34_05292 [Clitoria ternatea]|uniref:Uncharacterized protein n=1 Tax=Clitoria ternatea TaxID=43366 RepID=A0AAN9PSY1_CLITE
MHLTTMEFLPSILLFFFSFFFTFSSARLPSNSFSLSQQQQQHNLVDPEPTSLIRWEPEISRPTPETIESIMNNPQKIEPSKNNRLPFAVFSFDPRIPRRPLPLPFRHGHRCHHYKPWVPRPEKLNARTVRHSQIPGGILMRFGSVEPMLRLRGLNIEKGELLLGFKEPHQHHQPQSQIKKDVGFKLMKRIRKFLI